MFPKMKCLVLLFLLVLISSEKPKEFTASKDVVFFTRAEEVIIFGLFKDLKSKQAKTFKKVAKKYNAGYKFGMSADESVWSRFDNVVDVEKDAEVLILRNFRETGEKRRTGKDKVVFGGKFTKKKLNNFIVSEAIPPVIRFPDATKHGVDENNRFQHVQNLKLSKLYCFRKETGHSELLGKVGQNFLGKVLVFDIDARDPESKSFVEGLKPQFNDEGFGAVFMSKSKGPISYTGAFDEVELLTFVHYNMGSESTWSKVEDEHSEL